MALQIRRGTDAQRQTVTPLSGEFVWTTDLKELWAGDGSTVGGIKVSGSTLSVDDIEAYSMIQGVL